MTYDVVVIGGGIIGTSVAYELGKYQGNALLLERENDVAMGTTKANSAIVHAGYDPMPGTLMAKLNVQGAAMMEARCQELSVHYKKIGSLVLALSPDDLPRIQTLYDRGVQNGVEGLELLDRDQVRAMEPNVSDTVCGALYAPSAAILDPWGLCIAQAETAVRNGVTVKLRAKVTGIEQKEDHLIVHTTDGDYAARYVVNCAGAHAHEIAAMTDSEVWKPQATRGEYYLMDKTSGGLVNHVIFQCPNEQGKGVLVSQTVHGNLIVGPNAEEAPDADDTRTTAAGLQTVAQSARRSVPGVDLRQCIRTFAGIRAITDQADFIIRPSSDCPRVLHVAGIKSPGLSSAPAIGLYAMDLLKEMGLSLTPKDAPILTREKCYFRDLSMEEKKRVIEQNPRYGRIICRCETITEGEIVDAIHSPIPPCSIDGIKRRAGAGMGRCQGGFCGPRVLELLAKELGIDPASIPQDGDGTQIITGLTKGAVAHEV